MAKAATEGIETGDLRPADWSSVAALVLSPGVPLTHPEPHWSAKLAQAAGVEIIGDIELFCRERAKIAPTAPFVAITGTNGKSTTTALIAHILREAGRDVQMGGNIGTAILSLEPPAPDRFHVVEMSSFQIDLTPSLPQRRSGWCASEHLAGSPRPAWHNGAVCPNQIEDGVRDIRSSSRPR
jgi:UDP-N-acetylmuramoylalanine--D-glutamate ligase